jgi:hypothetical protein
VLEIGTNELGGPDLILSVLCIIQRSGEAGKSLALAILHPVVLQFGNNRIFLALHCLPIPSLVLFFGQLFLSSQVAVGFLSCTSKNVRALPRENKL